MPPAHSALPSGANESSSDSAPAKQEVTTKSTTKRIATFHSLRSEIITDLLSMRLKPEMSQQEVASFKNAMIRLYRRWTILLIISGLFSRTQRRRMNEKLDSTMESKCKCQLKEN